MSADSNLTTQFEAHQLKFSCTIFFVDIFWIIYSRLEYWPTKVLQINRQAVFSEQGHVD